MTAELVRGQNHPLPVTRVEIRVSAGRPVIAGATLNDAEGRTRDAGWVAHPAAPNLPGLEVSRQAAAVHRLAVDLGALPEEAHRVNVLLALPEGEGGPSGFGALAAPFLAVTDLVGGEIATYTVTGLESESAVVALELYRREHAWKVRAVGQGYAGGLAAMLGDQDLPDARLLADAINEAVAEGTARSVARPPERNGRREDGRREDGRRGDRDDAASAPASSAPGGPIDYRHPRRKAEPPPPRRESDPSQPRPQSHPGPIRAVQSPSGGPRSPQPQSAQPQPSPAPQSQPQQAPQPVAGDAPGWSAEERLYNQVWGMFEDLARTVAAYRSAVDFADSRRDRELEKVLDDPRTRFGQGADAARTTAMERYTQLAEKAQAVLDRDVEQLTAESEVVEPALPPAFARWDNPVWQAYQPPAEQPMALRVGDLSLPECPELRIPMLVRLPLDRGLWIDSGRESGGEGPAFADPDELRRLAAQTATALAARIMAVHPAGDFSLHVIDPAGSAATALAPLVESGALREPPAVGAEGVARVLERLTRRVDLVQMAVRSGATDALPDDLDVSDQLLVVHDFPHGFDDRAVTQLRYLADEGPSVGVSLMMVADRQEASGYGPVLDPLWRSLLRLSPVPDDHLADPWVGHSWTYEPPLAPYGSQVVPQVLRRIVAARQSDGR
ncbi:TerD family protein [Streptomyces iconiensis]|uniref:TerD family protein n=1 Tax=Streptomyces iconiensis TaxID=1384038 RepID=A0ABT6ZVR0_9ACTN|nr:TerD family protein [Streptomyces iconiensis]MDJ1133160.1 TerD family protein [Streptomyces iconiensis]